MNLFGDFLSVSADSQINAGEDVLFVDEETLKQILMRWAEAALQISAHCIPSMKAEDTTEIKRHVQTVQEEWASRGVAFRENERIRLITVFFHDPTIISARPGMLNLLTAEDRTAYFLKRSPFQERSPSGSGLRLQIERC